MSLSVCEIFYSLQGESSFAGRPCVFIRLSGCNLRCSYCDTRYAWGPGTKMEIPEILSEIHRYPTRLVEVTGGEPLWQEQTYALLSALCAEGYTCLLETNGSLWLEEMPAEVVRIIDVKCPGSGCGDSFMKWNLKQLKPRDELKFVLTSPWDYRFALDFIRANSLQDRTIHFSPVTSVLKPETLAKWMLRDGVTARLQLQLHRILDLK
ncbi:MAG TPA: radical SAM protein [Candidatus Syntrophosphaera sp.]|nr:radical SAM protein [Candidatus Syntrophosphaera sp.]HPH60106.1 radical SAM protein [Candidatus Syntrophosphaera sp.]